MEPLKKSWINTQWRPAMAWMYLVVCVADFVVFPVLWVVAHIITGGAITPWAPLTLQGAGLFHMAMGAVIGIAAWGRTKEKILGAEQIQREGN